MLAALFPLCLLALSSNAALAVPGAVAEWSNFIDKRAAEVGSIPFAYSGLHKRQNSVAPGAKSQLGTSNPAPGAGDLNSADVASATSGNGGDIQPFGRLGRRSSVNEDSFATVGGDRRIKRQAASGKVDLGAANPFAPASNLHNKGDDNVPMSGSVGGGITEFNQRSRRAAFASDELQAQPHVKEKRQVKQAAKLRRSILEPRLAQMHEVNLVSHTIATRGFGDGRIEPIA